MLLFVVDLVNIEISMLERAYSRCTSDLNNI